MLDKADETTKKHNVKATDVHPVQRNAARQWFVETHEEGHYCRLATARWTHDAGQLFGGNGQIQAFQNRVVRS